MTGVGKITTGVAIVFMLTSLSLAYLSSETARDSVVRDLKPSAAAVPAAEQMLIPEEDAQAEKNRGDSCCEIRTESSASCRFFIG
jgi:preprotein translocase subunit SecG